MTSSADSTPIQRVWQIADEKLRGSVIQGIQITLDANLSHLRSIKDTEHKWVDLHSLITLPAIGYLMTVDRANDVWGWPLVAVVSAYLLLTGWVQYVLLRERYSYYSVLRTVARAQNFLGLYEVGFFSPHFAGSAFPRGYGPHPEADGTQPYSSFLRRQAYTIILFASLLATAGFRNTFLPGTFGVLTGAAFLVDLLWLVMIFQWDRTLLTTATEQERGLAGADPSWFPKRS